MAEKRLDITLGAKGAKETESALGRIGLQLKQLKRSDTSEGVEQIGKFLTGAVALGGFTHVLDRLRDAAKDFREIRIEMDRGAKTWGDAVERIVQAIPITGQVFDIISTFTDRTQEGIDKNAQRDKILTTLNSKFRSARDQEKLLGLTGERLAQEQARQKLNDTLRKINEDEGLLTSRTGRNGFNDVDNANLRKALDQRRKIAREQFAAEVLASQQLPARLPQTIESRFLAGIGSSAQDSLDLARQTAVNTAAIKALTERLVRAAEKPGGASNGLTVTVAPNR